MFSSRGKHEIISRRTARIQTMLANGGSYDHHYDTAATTHEITQETCAWIWDDILAHTS